VDGRGEEEEIN